MAKMLIVDDEIGIAEIVAMALEDEGHEIRIASHGKEAIELIPLYRPDMIISDIKMTPINGIELLHWCRKNYADAPLVFMTGFADILLLQEALELGAFSLIRKPFDVDEILSVVEQAIGEEDKASSSQFFNEDFCKIDLKKFILGSRVNCAIYIKIRDNHFVKLAEKNDPIPEEKLIEYQKKNLQFLYVLKDEFGELVGFNMKVLKAIEKREGVPPEKLASFINYTNSILMEKIFTRDLDNTTLNEVRDYGELVLSVMARKKVLFDVIENLANSAEYLYAHSLSTAVMSYLIAKEIGWESESNLFKVYLAGLLHDIGLKDYSHTLIEKNPYIFTDEELKNYQEHPAIGMRILNELKDVPEEVILAAYQHHETCNGEGYPQKLKKIKISPISRIVAIADIIDAHPLGNRDLSMQAYRKIALNVEKTMMARYDDEFFKAFKRVLKI